MPNNQSPCLTCKRVKDPRNCENKSCKLWRDWFLDRWQEMRCRVLGIDEKTDGVSDVD